MTKASMSRRERKMKKMSPEQMEIQKLKAELAKIKAEASPTRYLKIDMDLGRVLFEIITGSPTGNFTWSFVNNALSQLNNAPVINEEGQPVNEQVDLAPKDEEETEEEIPEKTEEPKEFPKEEERKAS